MKKIIIVMTCLLMCGCSSKSSIEISESMSNSEMSEGIEKEELDFSDKKELSLQAGLYVKKQFSSLNMYEPSEVRIFVGENHDYIGFKYETDIDLDDVYIEAKVSFPEDYLYYGKLTRLSENVYSSYGRYPSSWAIWSGEVSDDVDFYIIENDGKYYFCFDDLSLEELENYTNECGMKILESSDTLQRKLDFSDKKALDLNAALLTEELFLNLNMFPPTGVDIFIGENHDCIGFTYQYGIYLPHKVFEEIEASSPRNESGSLYLYYGKLTRLSENVYSSCGNYPSVWKICERKVSSDIDFYIIENDEKYYICFEDLSLGELENYTNEYGMEIFKYYE